MRSQSRSSIPWLLQIALLVLLPVVDAGAQAGGTPAVSAATPPAAPGRTLLLQAVLGQPPDAPAVLRLVRVTGNPAADLPEIGGADPTFLVMESGRMSLAVDGAAVLLPAAGGDAAARTIPPVGESFAFGPEDRLALAAGTLASLAILGDGPAAVLVVTMEAAGSAVTAGTPETAAVAAAGQGTTVQRLGEGRVDDFPDGRLAVTLERFSLDAGLGMPPYPGPALVAVERGGFASTLDAGDVQVWQGDASGSPPAIPAGGSFTVSAGDALFFPNGMEATPPLAGDGALILLRLGILPLPEPAFPAGGAVVVTQDGVRLRSGPSTAENVVAGLAAGQTLLVTGPPVEDDGRLWVPVRDPNDPTLVGYIAGEFLTATG